MIVSGIRHVAGRNDYADRDGRKYAVAIHNTSNDATAEQEASYATRRTDGVSAHFYVDADSVIQSIDTKYRTGHAGSNEGNDNAVSVEITGTNGKSRQWWLDNVAWDRLAAVLAIVCKTYDIEPRRASVAEMKRNPKVRAFYGHNDMRLAWGGTTHTDPGTNFPWDHLLAKVQRALAGEDDDMPSAAEIATETLGRRYRDYVSAADGSVTRPVSQILLDARTDSHRAVARVEGLERRVEAGFRAVLDAQAGVDTDTILARIDEHAQAERERDEAGAARDAELLALVQAGQDGSVEAAEVVRRMGELLTAQQR
ncbi:N-acetylmuramoyl-L-alanine amidase [Micromonospora echinospora]|uniref:N-acetylmuramoyl-L-alanine amidase n=1 Tax=Micromonospora echinospora TaxID=1877 RepID=UPI003A83AD2A